MRAIRRKTNFKLKRILLLAALLLALPLLASEKPNVILIITDDQGWGDIGYNNPGKVYSPHLDRLASEGIVFKSHYVMPQCTPTRVAAFTGRYPSRLTNAALSATNSKCLPIGTLTLARMFKKSGYQTYLCGKWHMGSDPANGPNHHGFDYSYGSLAGAVGMYDHRYRETTPYFETWHRNHEVIPGWENGRHATDLVAEDAIRIIEQDRENPFFLMLTFHAVHTPLDERGRFVDTPTQVDPDNPNRWLNEDEIEWFHDPEGIIQSETDREKRLLLATVHHLDSAIGNIVQAIDAEGVREDTLILFTSDNGPQVDWSGEAYPDDLRLTNFNQEIPMRGSKGDVWEGGIHVPAFANWPGKLKPGELDQPVHIIDWFPTLANIIGHETDEPLQLDGVDIGPALFHNIELPQRDFYWIWNRNPNRWALRYGDWKIVRYGSTSPTLASTWQLFNLVDDPEEKRNVSAFHPEVRSRLHRLYLKQSARDNLVPPLQRD